MAKLIEGILGSFRGSVGTVIGYSFKGSWCMRAKPRFVHNPRTEKQQEHRMLFGDMVRLAARMLPALKLGFRHEAEERGMTEGNAFVKINWQRTGGRLTYSELQVARGPLAPVGFEGYEIDDEGVMTVRWEKNPTRGRANTDDKVIVFLYNAAQGESKLVDRAMRREQSVSILFPDGWAMEDVHVYGFVMDSEGRCSGSASLTPNPSPIGEGRMGEMGAMGVREDTEEIYIYKKNPTSAGNFVSLHRVLSGEKSTKETQNVMIKQRE